MKKIFLAFLFFWGLCLSAIADESAFAAWVTRSVNSGSWEKGKLATFTDSFTKRITANSNDYNARVLRAMSLGLSLVENNEAHAILAKFGFSLDFRNGFSLTGALDSTSYWPASNTLSDKALELCKPVLGQIIEDLSVIPESWGGMVLSNNIWPIDETVKIDYADILYIKSMCYEVLGGLYLFSAYDIDVNYKKGESLLTSHNVSGGIKPRIPVLSSMPSLNSDSGWANSAIIPVERNEFVNAIRVAFYGNKMYVRLIMKSGVTLPADASHCFYADIDADGMDDNFDMYVESWNDDTVWHCRAAGGYQWDEFSLSIYDGGKILVFDLPSEMIKRKNDLYVFYIEVGIGEMVKHVENNEWGGEWSWWEWESKEWICQDDILPCAWHLYAEQTGVFRNVRNKNNLIYSREYMRLALNNLKSALAADEERVGNNLRLIECSALEDYQYIRNRLYKYIDQAIASLTTVATIDISDFSYFRGIYDVYDDGFLKECNSLLGTNVISYSFAPVFNGLSPREYLPTGITLQSCFSGVNVALNTMKDPTFAGIFPGANDTLWYRLASHYDVFNVTGTPRGYVTPTKIPINGFVPSVLYGVRGQVIPSFVVTFNANGGVLSSSSLKFVEKGQVVGSLPTPTRNGYTFIGWYTSASGGTKISTSTVVTGDVIYYAQWRANTYTVRFHRNRTSSDTTVKDQAFTYGLEQELSWISGGLKWDNPDHSFMGWATSSSNGVVYSNGQKVTNLAAAQGTVVHLYAVWRYLGPTYIVRYHKYDGSGSTCDQTLKIGEAQNLLWLSGGLKWSRPGYEFVGWVPWNPDSKARLCKYVNGQVVKDIGKKDEIVHLYAAWKSASSYRVCFHRNTSSSDGEMMNQVILRNKEDGLAWMDSQIGWTRPGYLFKGWSESADSTVVKYVNGSKVKNLAMNGGTKHLYAVWSINTYTVRYHKYDGSGTTRDQVFTVGKEQNLLWKDSQLNWSRSGYEFVGWVPWNPDAKPRLCRYANGQKVKNIGKTGAIVHLYAAWKSASSYRVCFHRNTGPSDGEMMNQVILRNREDQLAWFDSQICWTRPGYVFRGWSESANSSVVKYANGATVKNLAMDGGTKHLYAVWRIDSSVASVSSYAMCSAEPLASWMNPGDLASANASEFLPGHYFGELADGTGMYDLLVDEGCETGYVNIIFDDGSSMAEEVDVCFKGDVIVVIDNKGSMYELARLY